MSLTGRRLGGVGFGFWMWGGGGVEDDGVFFSLFSFYSSPLSSPPPLLSTFRTLHPHNLYPYLQYPQPHPLILTTPPPSLLSSLPPISHFHHPVSMHIHPFLFLSLTFNVHSLWSCTCSMGRVFRTWFCLMRCLLHETGKNHYPLSTLKTRPTRFFHHLI